MDADNRVVLNCGGIRHEVYKVIFIVKHIKGGPAKMSLLYLFLESSGPVL